EVVSLLAQSRQSLLYRVRDSLGQRWLLKTLPANRHDETNAGQSLLLEEWFLRRVAGRYFPELHPAPDRQHLYYLMREHGGRTLAELFELSGPVSVAHWQDLATRLLRAVGLLHRRNIIH